MKQHLCKILRNVKVLIIHWAARTEAPVCVMYVKCAIHVTRQHSLASWEMKRWWHISILLKVNQQVWPKMGVSSHDNLWILIWYCGSGDTMWYWMCKRKCTCIHLQWVMSLLCGWSFWANWQASFIRSCNWKLFGNTVCAFISMRQSCKQYSFTCANHEDVSVPNCVLDLSEWHCLNQCSKCLNRMFPTFLHRCCILDYAHISTRICSIGYTSGKRGISHMHSLRVLQAAHVIPQGMNLDGLYHFTGEAEVVWCQNQWTTYHICTELGLKGNPTKDGCKMWIIGLA